MIVSWTDQRFLRRLVGLWLFASIISGAVVPIATPVAAFPLQNLSTIARDELAPSIMLVRDVCGIHYEGNTKVTRYCDDPYVCDRANPGKCKPGPALQRQLDAERQRRDEALRSAQQRLDQLQRDMEARLRNLRRATRTTSFTRTTTTTRSDDRRASNCQWEQNLGSRVLYCQSSLNNDRIVPSPQYGKARPPLDKPVYGAAPRAQQASAPRSRPASVRAMLKFALMARDYYAMEPNDPDRAELERRILATAKQHAALGEDVAPALKKIFEDAASDAVAKGQKNLNSLAPPSTLPPVEAPAAVQPAPDPPKPYSDKDEALCSYLMTLEPDKRDDRRRMTRLGQAVPAYCDPYMRSLPKSAEAQPASAPAFYLPERDREEARKIADEFYRQNVLPPDYAQ